MISDSQSITVDDIPYPLTVKKQARQKHMRIIIHADGSVVVSVPRTYTRTMIASFVQEHRAWICAQRTMLSQRMITIDPCVVQHMKKVARRIVEERIAHFNAFYQFRYTAIHIRHQKTRWGSCSSAGVLSFNCALVALPQDLRDYIIVHELCHLWEMNHAPRFWALVAQTLPDYKEHRARLRRVHFV